MNKIRRSPVITGFLFILAIVLLFAGSVGGTQAALQVYSNDYLSALNMKNIGVTLLENGEFVSWRNYGQDTDTEFKEKPNGNLVLEHLKEDPSFQIGKKYPFKITAKNTGDIYQYLRITVYKYWVKVGDDEEFDIKGWFHGLSNNTEKQLDDSKFSPATIHLGYGGEEGFNSSAWILDSSAHTAERDVYYYVGTLSPEVEDPDHAETEPLFDTLWIDPSVTKTAVKTEEGNVTTYTYTYDGCGFLVVVEVDAVQTHNARAAIRSAWGLQDESIMNQMNIPAE